MPYFGSDPHGMGPDENILPVRNVYPGSDGGTLGTLASASSPDSFGSMTAPDGDMQPMIDTPEASGVGGLAWWVGIAMIVGLILFVSKKTGQASEFSNVRASTYNVLLITLIAVLGLTGLKIVAVKVKNLPGMSGFADVVIAA